MRASTVNVNYRYRVPEIVHVVGDSDAEVIVFHGSFAERYRGGGARSPHCGCCCRSTTARRRCWTGAERYEELVGRHDPMPPTHAAADDRLMLYTGGTTGLPKGVVWTHAELFGALATVGYATMGIAVPETSQTSTTPPPLS